MKKIDQIIPFSFILCVFVVIIHNPTKSYFDYGDTWATYGVHYLLADILPRLSAIAVPSFFIISAFLFYRTYTVGKTKDKLKSRFKTLVIPYLIWNIIGLGVVMLFKLPFISRLSTDMTNPFDFFTILQAIFLHQYTPLWFVFALIVYSLFCPLFYNICKNKLIGLMGG